MGVFLKTTPLNMKCPRDSLYGHSRQKLNPLPSLTPPPVSLPFPRPILLSSLSTSTHMLHGQ